MLTLTARQLEILDFIRESIKNNDMPPTVAEIAEGMNLSSTNGVRGHLQALERKGAIELIPNASRGIRLVQIDMFEQGLPLVGRVAAGQPMLAEENIEDYRQVDPGIFTPNADYLLRVQGESMRDVGILDGDLLAVHRRPAAENGQIIVARLENEVTVKRLNRQGHIVYLEAENPDFQAIEVNLKEQALDIEGIAVGVIRQF
ncbi:MAG: repressor LexA [Gammaproteobacteria bacterium]|jgi:repressor LexA|nr:repressor LexA [Gammaproteobacteria bacterium]